MSDEEVEALEHVHESDGILNRAFQYAFAAMESREDAKYNPTVTCAELYNDQARLGKQ